MIPFNKPAQTGKEFEYIAEALKNQQLSSNGPFSIKCESFLESLVQCRKALLTHSCSAALEIAAKLVDVREGDEVIVPSYTFVSTASAFAARGARLSFVDIRPDTMNLDENFIEQAITSKTKIILPVHYGGVGCEMDKIMEIANKHGLTVIEDAAQGIMANYKGRPLGSLGHLGCFSFHETKNLTSGEGGALLINRDLYKERAEIVRDKGTNRAKFFRGQVDKYTWIDIGSNYGMSDLNAAYLWAQLEMASEITASRLQLWNRYHRLLKPLEQEGILDLPRIPEHCQPNGHLYYIKVQDSDQRKELIDYLKSKGIVAVFHFVPLHESHAGKRYGRFIGKDRWTSRESNRLLRLPLWYGMSPSKELDFIVEQIYAFYGKDSLLKEPLKADTV